MADLKYYDIILKPLVTEKSMMAMEKITKPIIETIGGL